MKTKSIFLVFATVASSLFLGCSNSDSTSATLTVLGGSDVSTQALAGQPLELNLNLYALYVSPNADCTGAILVQDYGPTPVTKQFLASPTLFIGSPASGTYQCVVLKMQDIITFKANSVAVAANTSACIDTNTVHTMDIFRIPENDWKDVDGNTIVATGTGPHDLGPDIVYTFVSTNPAAATGGPLALSANQMLTLSAPLIVPGSGTFLVNAANSIDTVTHSSVDYCSIENLSLGFE